MIAVHSDKKQRPNRYQEAKQKLDEAIQDLESVTGKSAPYSFDVIRARIYIGDKQWQKAINLLEATKDKLDDQDDKAIAYLLLAAANQCLNNGDKAAEYLNHFYELLRNKPDKHQVDPEYFEYFNKITDDCHTAN